MRSPARSRRSGPSRSRRPAPPRPTASRSSDSTTAWRSWPKTRSESRSCSSLAATRSRMGEERTHREAALAALATEEDRLDRLVKRKAQLQQRAEGEAERLARRMQELTASAKDLKDLIERL